MAPAFNSAWAETSHAAGEVGVQRIGISPCLFKLSQTGAVIPSQGSALIIPDKRHMQIDLTWHAGVGRCISPGVHWHCRRKTELHSKLYERGA
jgi:hypothetical protein